jgi:hypothetical protein
MSALPPKDDLVADRRRELRIIVSLPGQYWLMSQRTRNGARPQFACRAINVSPSAVALVAPVQGTVGERVMADIEQFGKVHGRIERLLRDRGFVMRLAVTETERAALRDKVDWIEKHKNLEVSDRRNDARFAPKNPFSTVVLPDGKFVSCFVVNLSVTGAAVSADTVPEIGTSLALGTVVGHVIRHIPGGFAIKFLMPQDPDAVESLAIARMNKLAAAVL